MCSSISELLLANWLDHMRLCVAPRAFHITRGDRRKVNQSSLTLEKGGLRAVYRLAGQFMKLDRNGAHLLVQVRVAALYGELKSRERSIPRRSRVKEKYDGKLAHASWMHCEVRGGQRSHSPGTVRYRLTSRGDTNGAWFPQELRTYDTTAATSASLSTGPNGCMPYGRGLPWVLGGYPPFNTIRIGLIEEVMVIARLPASGG
jgi:hypothetical protein